MYIEGMPQVMKNEKLIKAPKQPLMKSSRRRLVIPTAGNKYPLARLKRRKKIGPAMKPTNVTSGKSLSTFSNLTGCLNILFNQEK
jgi:hypothetical protein